MPSNDHTLLTLTGELTIYRAAEVKADLQAAIEHDTNLDIDLSGISDIDIAGIQLLLLAKRTVEGNRRVLRLCGQSAVVQEVFDRVNLASHFNCAATPEQCA